ncbi:MAG: NADH-quinone oxidoreductase subunit L [Candidatus Riflebacteria bacterium]|nr:NADH-quinone oxidoreductase subunit L [Candidatus Riflebacteria bacterium]
MMIFLPVFFVFLLNLPFFSQEPKKANFLALGMALFQIVVVAGGFLNSFEFIAKFVGTHFSLVFLLDKVSLLILLVTGLISFSACLIGEKAFNSDKTRFYFFNLILLDIAALNGLALTSDIFTLYIYIEATTIISFILIALNKEIRALEGAFKYVVMTTCATMLFLSAIGIVMMITGSTSFDAIKAGLASSGTINSVISSELPFSTAMNSTVLKFALGLFLIGLFIKGGIVPFHGWVADAYGSAPTPVSLMLAGAVTKAGGIYSLVRIVHYIFPFKSAIGIAILIVGTISIVVGALAAMGQKELKRMLAFSSVSQTGYILLGIGTGTDLGLAGALFHYFNHSILKAALFSNSAALESSIGHSNISEINGQGSKMPVTAFTSIVASMSTAGVPPLSGFWSKLVIVIALWKAGFFFFSVVAVLASILTLAYMLGFQKRAFFLKPPENSPEIKEASLEINFPAIAFCLVTICIGLLFPYVVGTIILPVDKIL